MSKYTWSPCMTFFILHTCIQDAYDHDATKCAKLLLIQVHSARSEDFLFQFRSERNICTKHRIVLSSLYLYNEVTLL